jgi:hypothetical protein
MKSNNYWLVSCLLVIIIIATGCSPDTFILNRNKELKVTRYNGIYGIKLSDLDMVNVINDNSIALSDTGFVVLGFPQITQFTGVFSTKITNGNSVSFILRTIYDHYPDHQKIRFDYTSKGCKVYENEREIASVDSIIANKGVPAIIKIQNNADNFCITVDCDTVLFAKTSIPATEYIMIQAHKTNVTFSGIDFEKTPDEVKIDSLKVKVNYH